MATLPTRIVDLPLRTERLANGKRQLLCDLSVAVEDRHIKVPEGSVTDFSSVPWFARFVVRWSKVDIAGVVHDHLYKSKSMSRTKADKVWRLVAISGEHHANLIQAYTYWIFLRLFGWYFWGSGKSVE